LIASSLLVGYKVCELGLLTGKKCAEAFGDIPVGDGKFKTPMKAINYMRLAENW
jgi:hypothetical protein